MSVLIQNPAFIMNHVIVKFKKVHLNPCFIDVVPFSLFTLASFDF